MKLSLASRFAILIGAITLSAISVAIPVTALWSSQAYSKLETNKVDSAKGRILKELHRDAEKATKLQDLQVVAESLALLYDFRIIIKDKDNQIAVDTLVGPEPTFMTPFSINDLDSRIPSAQLTGTLFLGSRSEFSLPWAIFGLLALIIIVASIGLAIPLSRGLTGSLRRVGEAVEEIRKGNLNIRVNLTRPSSEVQALALGVNSMTESLAASEIQRKRLSSDISHELRSPLTNIRNILDAIEDGILVADSKFLKTLDFETSRLSSLVNDLSLVNQLDEGVIKFNIQDIDLQLLCENVLDAHRAAALQSNISITLVGAAAIVAADPKRVAQILDNLLSNALRYTPQLGYIEISIVDDIDFVKVIVTDSGPGVAPENLQQIFDRLWRADTARGHHQNHGLGLSIARGLARAQGGDLSARNSDSSGLECTLLLNRNLEKSI